MKRIVLIVGMIIALVFSIVVLTGCAAKNVDNVDVDLADETKDVEKTEEAKEVIMNEYSYKDLSFTLPDTYAETESDNEDAVMYSTTLTDNVLKMFSVATIEAPVENFVDNAAESLKEYEFKLPGYDSAGRKAPEVVEYNGIKAVVIDCKYYSGTLDSNARVEYAYAQKGDTIYVICFEYFAQQGKTFTDADFFDEFDGVKSSLKFAE